MKPTIGMTMMIDNDENGRVMLFPSLSAEANLVHFVSTRSGGVSTGNYASFNLGEYCGDTSANVTENRRLLCESLHIPDGSLFAPYQIHGDHIATIDQSFLALSVRKKRTALQGVDALITMEPNVCIAVTTADCVPILLYAPDKGVVAAVHAGWRGTVLRIVQKVVRLMCNTYGCKARTIKAAIGPSIGVDAYEVGEEVVDAFNAAGIDTEKVVARNLETNKSNKPHIDLWLANRLQLLEEGIADKHIETAGICTYTHSDRFFSARRLGIESGRMLSGIMKLKS